MVNTLDFCLDIWRVVGSRLGWSLHCFIVSLDKKYTAPHCVSSPKCINGYLQHTARGSPVVD